jgi:LCCL domain
MKPSTAVGKFLQFLAFVTGGTLLIAFTSTLAVSGADDKKQFSNKDSKSPYRTPEKSPGVEVRFTDNSLLKLKLDDDRLEFTTPYGKLYIPVSDIQRIDFATRVAPETAKRIQLAVKNLGSSEFYSRDSASTELMTLGLLAYPALLEAAKDKDPEVVRRADDLLERLRGSVPEEELQIRNFDVIQTENSKIAGWVQGTALKATTGQFGPVQLKLEDLRSFHSLTIVPVNDDNGSAPDPGNLVNFQNQLGKTFAFRVTGATNGSVWGTDLYTADSNLASAAVHAGVLKVGQTKVVHVKIVAAPPVFQSSTRHGVSSSAYGFYPGAYQVMR